MQGFFENLYKFINVHLHYKNVIMNQSNIHHFYSIF
jgi:hypothetical protein